MRLGDLLQNKHGHIYMIVKDNSGETTYRVVYIYFKSSTDGLNGTISGADDSYAKSLYEDSIIIGNITDIIARCKDG